MPRRARWLIARASRLDRFDGRLNRAKMEIDIAGEPRSGRIDHLSLGYAPGGCARGRHRPQGVFGATDDDALACLVLLG